MLPGPIVPVVLLSGLFWALRRGALPEHFRSDGDELGGWWESSAWYARYAGGSWQGPRWLTSAQADNWFVDAVEHTTRAARLTSNALAKWTGSKWVRVR